MRIDAKALAITTGVIWGGCVLLLGLVNLGVPGYGAEFLAVVGSIYPGAGEAMVGSVLLGALYGLIDGMIGGWLFAIIYNIVAKGSRPAAQG